MKKYSGKALAFIIMLLGVMLLPSLAMAGNIEYGSGFDMGFRVGGGYARGTIEDGGIDCGARFGWRWLHFGIDATQSFLLWDNSDPWDEKTDSIMASTIGVRYAIGFNAFEFVPSIGAGIAYGSAVSGYVQGAIRFGIDLLFNFNGPGKTAMGFFMESTIIPNVDNNWKTGVTATAGFIVQIGFMKNSNDPDFYKPEPKKPQKERGKGYNGNSIYDE